MTIGAEELLRVYGSPLGVAEALLDGKISSYSQMFVRELVDDTILKAAEIRVRLRREEARSAESKA